MKKYCAVLAALVVVITALPGITGCTPETRFEETRSLMDTYVKVVVYSNEKTATEAIDAAFARMSEIEKRASIYDPESEAFKLNQNGYLDGPSDDLYQLINLSLDYHRLSDGYFDITVQPLLDLWSAGLWKESPEAQQNKIDQTMGLIDSDKIDVARDRISLKVSGMKITLGAIAKGYAVDEALKVIKSKGIKYALVDAGGDLAALGSKPGGDNWDVALVNPDDTTQSLAAFGIVSKAVATSGNYARYFNPEKTVHHILNPKTGYSAGECISVTIIAENCTNADALATSVFVMGPENGMKLVESLDNVECLIVDNNRNIYRSSGLSEYLTEK